MFLANCFSNRGFFGIDGRWGTGGNFFSGGNIVMMIGFLVLAGLMVYLIVKRSGKSNDDDLMLILKSRLAKGEITKEEYDSLKRELV